jgi:cell division protein FtsI (penicillin-binding protein 3)
MVSTIANGGVYLPPHIIMPDQPNSSELNQKAAGPQSSDSEQTVHAAESHTTVLPSDLPDPLPGGAHRVISTMAAAEMRKMMEGVVLLGTGKPAQLNGYSSGGKTGTAQKIDPATHTYSKTMHIASFAGFAPVNNPVISVAIVMDSPKGDYYGTAVSAPIFADVAQQVLEYLGVPHDIDLQPSKAPSKKEAPIKEDEASSDAGDINALYAAANDLPSDDPLRAAPVTAKPPSQLPGSAETAAAPSHPEALVPATAPAPKSNPPQTQTSVVIANAGQLRVPSLVGLSVRQAIVQAGSAGLEVEITGNGTAREQAPVPGAMVSPGTKIVVRCAP